MVDSTSVLQKFRGKVVGISPPPLTELAGIIGAFLLVIFTRSFHYNKVFRNDEIVLLGNDPWAVRTIVDQSVMQAHGMFDVGSLLAFETRDPLFTLVLAWLSEGLGGTTITTGTILALYPVVSSLLIAGILYRVAWHLTKNRWVGIIVVGMLALSPGQAIRSSLGFADHHVFDQVWLAMTMLSLVVLSRTSASRRSRRLGILLLAGGLAGQVLSWLGGIIYIVPIGLFVAARTISDVREEKSPYRENRPVIIGIGVGSVVVLLAHLGFGWHTPSIAFVPVLLLVGVGIIIILAEVCRSRNYSLATIAELEILAVGSFMFLTLGLFPNIDLLLNEGLGYFNQQVSAVEAKSLFAGEFGVVAGPFLLFGLILYFAFPYLLQSSRRVYRQHDPGLLVVVCYSWFFLGLATVQRRFGAELALPLALIAGLGFLDICARLEIIDTVPLLSSIRPSLPSPPSINPSVSIAHAIAVGILIVLIISSGFFQISVLSDEVVIEDETYQTAIWMDQFSEKHDLAYPSNYVLSHWGRNRMFNYVVTENSRDQRYYRYAQRMYPRFVGADDGEYWYQRLRDIPVGFVVIQGDRLSFSGDSLSSALFIDWGRPSVNNVGVGHFRLRYASPSGEIRVFTLVPGAMVIGKSTPNTTVSIDTNIRIPDVPASLSYQRATPATSEGWWAIRVPYPGTYQTPRGTVSVTEKDINQGTVIGNRQLNARWTFDESDRGVIYDEIGGNHGWLRSATRSTGIGGAGLYIDGKSHAQIPDVAHLNGTDGFTLSVWFRLEKQVDYINDVPFPRLVTSSTGGPARNANGYFISLTRRKLIGAMGNGTSAKVLSGPKIDDYRWHHAVLTWNGKTANLYLDGRLVDNGHTTTPPAKPSNISIGSSTNELNNYKGYIDEVRFSSQTMNQSLVKKRFRIENRNCINTFNRSSCPTPETEA